MIVWICSYPRSGNTLTRIILKRCFGADSYDVHNIDPRGKLADITGHTLFDGTSPELLAAARADSRPWFIKTHGTEVPDGERAIYVVRDARAAIASYRRFRSRARQREFPLEDFVLGKPPLPSWSGHVAWARTRDPETTLILRFEELTNPDNVVLQRLSAFIGLPVLKPLDIGFEELHAVNPELYGVGHNAPGIAEVEAACSPLFWATHGEAMRALGYGEAP
jgi:hypothetical protein